MIAARINGEFTPLKGYTNYHITHVQNGFDTLSFALPMGSEQYPFITEESEIQTDANAWVVKKINDERIECEIDLDFLRAEFYHEYNSGSVLLATLLRSIFDDWTIEGAGVSTIFRTISEENVTSRDIVIRAQSTYNVRFLINAKDKVLTVIDAQGLEPTGEYITDQLNLTTLSYRGATSEIVTRLYPYGADGLTIEDAEVNGERYGLPYIDNNAYVEKVICGSWTDERFTDATALYNAASARLAELAIPSQSYECNVVDLAKLDERYNFLSFAMHQKLTLIDTRRNLRVVHQIVEYDEYPDEPTRNVVTLATAPQTVTSVIKSSVGGVVDMLNNSSVYETETRQIVKELTETVTSLQTTIQDNLGNLTQVSQSVDNLIASVASLTKSVSYMQTDSDAIWTFVRGLSNDITRYIRFYDGSICMGSSGSPVKIRIENNDQYKRFIIFSGEDFADEGIEIFTSVDATEIYDQFVRGLSSLFIGTDGQTAYKIDNKDGVFSLRRV